MTIMRHTPTSPLDCIFLFLTQNNFSISSFPFCPKLLPNICSWHHIMKRMIPQAPIWKSAKCRPRPSLGGLCSDQACIYEQIFFFQKRFLHDSLAPKRKVISEFSKCIPIVCFECHILESS